MKDNLIIDAEQAIEAQPKVIRAMPPHPEPGTSASAKTSPAVFHRHLFVAAMLEPTSADRARRKWSTFISIGLQSLVIGFLVLIPLIFPEVLPVQQLVTFLAAPPPPPPPPPPAPVAVPRSHVVSQFIEGRLNVPSRIPSKILMIKEDQAPISTGGVQGGVVGGVPGGQLGGVLGGLVGSSTIHGPTLLPPPAVIPKRVKISEGVSEGMLVSKIDPHYPVLALRARVQGVVLLRAVISREGTIENIEVVNGHALLIPAALEAVKSWRYRPYRLNGEPVEIETSITMNFHID